ncbi:unnamed protein product, partial [Phaeothamnion confervicola]
PPSEDGAAPCGARVFNSRSDDDAHLIDVFVDTCDLDDGHSSESDDDSTDGSHCHRGGGGSGGSGGNGHSLRRGRSRGNDLSNGLGDGGGGGRRGGVVDADAVVKAPCSQQQQ